MSNSTVVTCEMPAEVANGKRLWDSGDEPQYGEKVSYSCDEGYTLEGSSVLTCNENGEYDSQPPECKGKPSTSMCLLVKLKGGSDFSCSKTLFLNRLYCDFCSTGFHSFHSSMKII